jgi:hypothetical protein
VAEFRFHVPSVDALFDAWSGEPPERVPLSDEARERLLDGWTQWRKAGDIAGPLVLRLRAAERGAGSAESIAAAVHNDMMRERDECRHRWIRRSLRHRDSRIGLALFFVALLIGGLINWKESDPVSDTLAQTFIVLGWVAVWVPAQRVVIAASDRLGCKYYRELALVDVRIEWE